MPEQRLYRLFQERKRTSIMSTFENVGFLKIILNNILLYRILFLTNKANFHSMTQLVKRYVFNNLAF
jgi:hypothetical protein